MNLNKKLFGFVYRTGKLFTTYRWARAILSEVPILCIGTLDSIAFTHRYIFRLKYGALKLR